jgi:hypothetical protein
MYERQRKNSWVSWPIKTLFCITLHNSFISPSNTYYLNSVTKKLIIFVVYIYIFYIADYKKIIKILYRIYVSAKVCGGENVVDKTVISLNCHTGQD